MQFLNPETAWLSLLIFFYLRPKTTDEICVVFTLGCNFIIRKEE